MAGTSALASSLCLLTISPSTSFQVTVANSSGGSALPPQFNSLRSSRFRAGEALQGVTYRLLDLSIPRPPWFAVVQATKEGDSAEKRRRQAEDRRIYNKSRKSEIHTRMKKVFLALDGLKKKSERSHDDLLQIESLIAEAYSVIDKAVKVGTLHRNTGANRKSRLARAKKVVEIQLGWYTPA
eukprot:c19712_g1_i1 orf=258-803(-)